MQDASILKLELNITDEDFLEKPLIVYDSPFLEHIDFAGPRIKSETNSETTSETISEKKSENSPNKSEYTNILKMNIYLVILILLFL